MDHDDSGDFKRSRIMGLMLKRQKDGTLRDHWYGLYFDLNGQRRVVNLNIKLGGTPPGSFRVKDRGDAKFEASRIRAQIELDKFSAESRSKALSDNLIQKLISNTTGKEIELIEINQLKERWISRQVSSSCSKRYLQSCLSQINRFVKYINASKHKRRRVIEVTQEDVAGYIEYCVSQNLSSKTIKSGIQLLKKVFNSTLPAGAVNPFTNYSNSRAAVKRSETIHRRPLSIKELNALFEVAKADEILYPLVVCAAMTGLRKGDVCKLRWDSVDLVNDRIVLRTSKTGAKVLIPIFPRLKEVLVGQSESRDGKFVFPRAAYLYESNPDNLTWRLKRAMALALGHTPTAQDKVEPKRVLKQGLLEINRRVMDPLRRDRMTKVLSLYASGMSFRKIEKKLSLARSAISTDIKKIEGWIGKRITPGNGSSHIKSTIASITQKKREVGSRVGSILDWHALRVTWVTLALASDVPMEIVRKITGHSTVDVVRTNYFHPDDAQIKECLGTKLPDFMTGGKNGINAKTKLSGLIKLIESGKATANDIRELKIIASQLSI